MTDKEKDDLYADFKSRMFAELREAVDRSVDRKAVAWSGEVWWADLAGIFAAPPQAEQAKPPEQPCRHPNYTVDAGGAAKCPSCGMTGYRLPGGGCVTWNYLLPEQPAVSTDAVIANALRRQLERVEDCLTRRLSTNFAAELIKYVREAVK